MKLIYFFGILSLPIVSLGGELGDWIQFEENHAAKRLNAQIIQKGDYKGFVMASPSRVDPDYYYHWVRDAALVMETVRTRPDFFSVDVFFNNYFSKVKIHQTVPSKEGLGEPKYNLDGSAYKKLWGRPQNDGPALRALTTTRYIFKRLKVEPNYKEFVEKHLYRNELPAHTTVKRDLEYVSHHWQDPDFDLWEEVKGSHYYTRVVQWAALTKGADLAISMSDPGAASWYGHQARKIRVELEKHWIQNERTLVSTLNRTGGLDYKESNLDSSVILALNHCWDEFASATSIDRTLASLSKLMVEFGKIYSVHEKDGGVVPLGRYPEDRYFGGQPWFLLTNSAAEFLYRTVGYFDQNKSEIWVSHSNDIFFRNVLKMDVEAGYLIYGREYTEVKEKILQLADSFIQRVRKHTADSGQMDEQFDRHSGYMTGAADLTWSYASFLSMAKVRNDFLK